MILVTKKVGETPLELLDRLRIEKPELKDEKLSYAGRLDPMAEGETLVLVGDEENKNYEDYLSYDKEYIATFLLGVRTDTGDALGLIDKIEEIEISKEEIEKKIENFKNINKQTYPWFSSKTVNGKKLFDHYKEGNPENIVRPEREVEIYESELLDFNADNKQEDIKSYIFEAINKVNGDFRQKEILGKWEEYFSTNKSELITFKVKIKVGSGTYIRGLTEEFGFPVILLKLNRTKIFTENDL